LEQDGVLTSGGERRGRPESEGGAGGWSSGGAAARRAVQGAGGTRESSGDVLGRVRRGGAAPFMGARTGVRGGHAQGRRRRRRVRHGQLPADGLPRSQMGSAWAVGWAMGWRRATAGRWTGLRREED
jgi:hypothetical protein